MKSVSSERTFIPNRFILRKDVDDEGSRPFSNNANSVINIVNGDKGENWAVDFANEEKVR